MCVCTLLVFPMSSLFWAFLHTNTFTPIHTYAYTPDIQIYFVKHFPVFPYSKLQFRTPRCPYTHTHTHVYIQTRTQLYAQHTHTQANSERAANSLSFARSLFRSLMRTAAGAQTNRSLLPRLARKSILQAVGKYQKCINLPAK